MAVVNAADVLQRPVPVAAIVIAVVHDAAVAPMQEEADNAVIAVVMAADVAQTPVAVAENLMAVVKEADVAQTPDDVAARSAAENDAPVSRANARDGVAV